MLPRTALVAVALATLIASTAAHDAAACGMFAPRRLEDGIPAIAQERVVMIFDREKELQHFVREVHFDAGDDSFGFVVPTPSQPSVAAAKSPFDALAADYPFEVVLGASGKGDGMRGGEGAPGGAMPSVSVLSVKRVGKFKAFVLAASDSGALSKWLTDNQFEVPSESRAWLDHYVRLGFFYVAFRYDPPKVKDKAAARGLASETVRITFPTPSPYYPYMEPSASRTMPRRLLQLWLIGAERLRPVAALERRERLGHVQPWRAGLVHRRPRTELAKKLGALGKLLPKGQSELWVQTFRDLRTSRRGLGDVLLVPERPVDLDETALAKRTHLMPVLDPALATGPAGGAK